MESLEHRGRMFQRPTTSSLVSISPEPLMLCLKEPREPLSSMSPEPTVMALAEPQSMNLTSMSPEP